MLVNSLTCPTHSASVGHRHCCSSVAALLHDLMLSTKSVSQLAHLCPTNSASVGHRHCCSSVAPLLHDLMLTTKSVRQLAHLSY